MAVREMSITKQHETSGIYPVFETKFLGDEKKELPEPLTESKRRNAEKLLSKLTGGTLRHRGAHYEVVEMASKHQCPECQELRMAPLDPAVSSKVRNPLGDNGHGQCRIPSR